jgi:hypothetical protein
MIDSAVKLKNDGFAMITVLFMTVVLLAMVGSLTSLTRSEIGANISSRDSVKGFYAAEAGLNLRAEEVRQTFVGYNRPDGVSPTEADACTSGNMGTDDFACQEVIFGKHKAVTYVVEEPDNPLVLTIPPGERYQNLNAQEYRYTVTSKAIGINGQVEAILELKFKSRLVPLFQFAAFYNKDLEILPGPYMNLAGPVHTNGDLYLDSGNTLEIEGQVTAADDVYRGRKNNSVCSSNDIDILDPSSFRTLLGSCSSRTKITEAMLPPWNSMIQIGVPVVTVPEPEDLNPEPGKIYWDKADLRLVLHLNSSNNIVTSSSSVGVEVRDASNQVLSSETNTLEDAGDCPGSISGRAVGYSDSFYNNREGGNIHMLDVDMRALLNCIHEESLMGTKTLDDDTEGGLVIHLSVDGPDSAEAQSLYGVRVRNAAELQANVSGAPTIRGVTFVSDQAFYSMGDYNSINKIPSAFLADSYNALSNAWSDSNTSWSSRVPSDTTVNAAILAGTDVTGGVEGTGGQDSGEYNGGLENYPRFHEQWAKSPKRTFYYTGSFVSLNSPLHANGAWKYGSPQYTAPNRNWGYDTDFNNAENLPPITPRFVYLRQQLFSRDFIQ